MLTDSGLLPISYVNTNMSVWSRNPASGEMAWQRIQAQYSNPYDETVSVTLRDFETGVEQTIVSNRIHPYFVQTARVVANSSEGHVYEGPLEDGHWIDAAELRTGDLRDNGYIGLADQLDDLTNTTGIKSSIMVYPDTATMYLRGQSIPME
ncbi:MAG: polymorphic toxin-type HINT domain-containing protein [Aliishimia sp.]